MWDTEVIVHFELLLLKQLQLISQPIFVQKNVSDFPIPKMMKLHALDFVFAFLKISFDFV